MAKTHIADYTKIATQLWYNIRTTVGIGRRIWSGKSRKVAERHPKWEKIEKMAQKAMGLSGLYHNDSK